MNINVKNNDVELHYVFTLKLHEYYEYSIIFMYLHGIPTLIINSYRQHLFYITSHRLYEEAIQYILDNYKEYSPNCFIDIEPTKDDFIFLIDIYYHPYDKMTDAEKQEFRECHMIKCNNDFEDEIIENLEYVDTILTFAPFVSYQTCGNCYKPNLFNTLYIDIISLNNDPSLCKTCYDQLLINKDYYKLYPENKMEIRKSILSYLYKDTIR